MLKQTSNEPPPVAVGNDPEVIVASSSNLSVVLAVKLARAALIVVATPLMLVRTGVIVATGVPLASTETQGFGSANTLGQSQSKTWDTSQSLTFEHTFSLEKSSRCRSQEGSDSNYPTS
jgi:hypothetical protein